MADALFVVINPIVKALLRSPLHGLMSHNTLLLQFTGRKSGAVYVTPVSYHEVDGVVHCFTAREGRWWRNLEGGAPVVLTLRGRRRTGVARAVSDGSDTVRTALHDLLLAVPRDASHAQVALDAEGRPDPADLDAASQRLVLIQITLDEDDASA